MRKLLLTAVALAGIAAVPAVANAQANTLGGAATGAVVGGVVGGPPGAVVGGIIGGTVGASSEPRYYRGDDRYYAPAVRNCWRDEFGRRVCAYR
jgi:YMGG-like Gly-zipper